MEEEEEVEEAGDMLDRLHLSDVLKEPLSSSAFPVMDINSESNSRKTSAVKVPSILFITPLIFFSSLLHKKENI